MRGFEHGMAGPLSPIKRRYWDHDGDGVADEPYITVGGEPIGALNMVSFQTELLYPISKALGLRAAVFYDVGKGWGTDDNDPHPSFDENIWPLRHAVGLGIRWYSPFGPIRIDWGYNIDPKTGRGEEDYVWDFSMGAMF
jgi:outer membrane protein insertion porin family